MRLKHIRDGLEDLEFLYALEEKVMRSDTGSKKQARDMVLDRFVKNIFLSTWKTSLDEMSDLDQARAFAQNRVKMGEFLDGNEDENEEVYS